MLCTFKDESAINVVMYTSHVESPVLYFLSFILDRRNRFWAHPTPSISTSWEADRTFQIFLQLVQIPLPLAEAMNGRTPALSHPHDMVLCYRLELHPPTAEIAGQNRLLYLP